MSPDPNGIITKQIVQFGPFRAERMVEIVKGRYARIGRWKTSYDKSVSLDGEMTMPNRRAIIRWFKLHIPGTHSIDMFLWFKNTKRMREHEGPDAD